VDILIEQHTKTGVPTAQPGAAYWWLAEKLDPFNNHRFPYLLSLSLSLCHTLFLPLSPSFVSEAGWITFLPLARILHWRPIVHVYFFKFLLSRMLLFYKIVEGERKRGSTWGGRSIKGGKGWGGKGEKGEKKTEEEAGKWRGEDGEEMKEKERGVGKEKKEKGKGEREGRRNKRRKGGKGKRKREEEDDKEAISEK
jgi:hypothetical protein